MALHRASATDDFSECLALGLASWETSLFNPVSRVIKPLWVTVIKQPVTSNDGETIERKTHGFPNAHEATLASHLHQHMG